MSTAFLSWSLDIECPHCGEEFDISDIESFGTAIFSNQWSDLFGELVTCEHCGHEFEIEGVEH